MKLLLRTALLLALILLVVGAVPSLQSAASAEATYYIEIDITNQYVTVYRKSDMEIVRQMICSSGKSSTPSPIGTFTMPPKSRSSERTKWYTFEDCYAQYASRIRGGILFHSYLFSSKSDSAVIKSSVSNLGSAVSHGCIRLRIADAKWIAENCFSGTRVKIYRSGVRNDTLRQLLLSDTFSIDDGKSYAEWASIGGKGELGRGSTGAKVKSLQLRLVGMGYADMSADGVYGQMTIEAVKAFQGAAKLSKTGVTDTKTWDALFAADAPEGGKTPALYLGTTGAKVTALQNTLTGLKLYTGAIDGTFTNATRDAVNFYKRTHGISQNGIMESSYSTKAKQELADLIAKFGSSPFELIKTETTTQVVKITGASSVNMRASGSLSGKVITTLKKNTVVTIVAAGKTWTKITAGSKTGYVMTKFLKTYTETVEKWEYRLIGAEVTPEPTPTDLPELPEITLEPTATPEPTPSDLPELPEITPEPTATPTLEPTLEPTSTIAPFDSLEPTDTATEANRAATCAA